LNRTFSYYLPKIESALEKGRVAPDRQCAPDSESLEREFLRHIEPPVVIAMSSPAVLLPPSAIDPDQIIEQFPYLRRRFTDAVQSAIDSQVLDISISDSIHPPVQSLGGVLALLAAHERRHLWQAQQVLSSSDFPACPASRFQTITEDVKP
jgi:hypothetical protein